MIMIMIMKMECEVASEFPELLKLVVRVYICTHHCSIKVVDVFFVCGMYESIVTAPSTSIISQKSSRCEQQDCEDGIDDGALIKIKNKRGERGFIV